MTIMNTAEAIAQVCVIVGSTLAVLFFTPVGEFAVRLLEKLIQFVGQFYELKTTLEPTRQSSPSLNGTVGTALSDLRPTGVADIGGKRVHVAAIRGFIEKGRSIRVVRIEGDRVYVEPMSGEADALDAEP